MGIARNLALTAVGAVVVVGAVVAVKTATYRPPAQIDLSAVKLAPSIPIDNAKAAQHLGAAVRIQTVSHQDPADDVPANWETLHQFLQTTYPAAHAAMTRTIVSDRTLVYEWTGSDPKLAPIVLMAHQDVVPVSEGTEKDWKHPPFSGEIAEDAVWGRGSIDDKGSLIGLFEAIDALAAKGFKPRRTIYLVSGQNEEVGGGGAPAAAAYLKSKGVTADFVLDEGMAVITDNPITGKPAALIGVAEKGYATLIVTARSTGGHSSAPPKQTGVVTLAKAVIAITEKPFALRFDGPAAQMMRALAPSASTPVRMAVANDWLFKPILLSQISATPAGAALLHTTIAPTMLKGSPKDNVLPQKAQAWINYRIDPSSNSGEVMARAKEAAKGMPVEFAWERTPDEPSRVSSTDSEGWKAIAALAAEMSKAPVAPGLMTAATDSRYLQSVTKDTYRFQPLLMSLKDIEMIHGTNEHLTLDNLARMTDFYARLIETTAG